MADTLFNNPTCTFKGVVGDLANDAFQEMLSGLDQAHHYVRQVDLGETYADKFWTLLLLLLTITGGLVWLIYILELLAYISVLIPTLVVSMYNKIAKWRHTYYQKTLRYPFKDLFYMESTRPTSPIHRLNPADCQVVIATGISKPEEVLGGGWRYGDELITCGHVLAAKDPGYKLWMYKPTLLSSGVEAIEIKYRKDPIHIGTDAVAITVKSWPQGVRAAKIATDRVDSFVSICGPKNEGSLGQTRPSTSFGMIEYSGSTIGGFSGMPYMQGSAVVGMHVSGGAINLGYDATYLICQMPKKNEDTVDWLEGMIKKKKSLKVQRYGLDDYIVHVEGRYHLMDSDIFAELEGRGVEWETEYDDDDKEILTLREKRTVVDDHPRALPRVSKQKSKDDFDDDFARHQDLIDRGGFSWAEEMERELECGRIKIEEVIDSLLVRDDVSKTKKRKLRQQKFRQGKDFPKAEEVATPPTKQP